MQNCGCKYFRYYNDIEDLNEIPNDNKDGLKFIVKSENIKTVVGKKKSNEENNKVMNLGKFFYEFLNFFSRFNFKDYIIDIGSKLIKSECPYNVLDISDDKYKNLGYGKSLVIIDPLSGVNASKSSYKIDEISNTFYNAFDYFVNEINEYERGGYKNQKYNKNNNENMVMGLNNQNKNNDSNGGGNIIEKFLLKK